MKRDGFAFMDSALRAAGFDPIRFEPYPKENEEIYRFMLAVSSRVTRKQVEGVLDAAGLKVDENGNRGEQMRSDGPLLEFRNSLVTASGERHIEFVDITSPRTDPPVG